MIYLYNKLLEVEEQRSGVRYLVRLGCTYKESLGNNRCTHMAKLAIIDILRGTEAEYKTRSTESRECT